MSALHQLLLELHLRRLVYLLVYPLERLLFLLLALHQLSLFELHRLLLELQLQRFVYLPERQSYL